MYVTYINRTYKFNLKKSINKIKCINKNNALIRKEYLIEKNKSHVEDISYMISDINII